VAPAQLSSPVDITLVTLPSQCLLFLALLASCTVHSDAFVLILHGGCCPLYCTAVSRAHQDCNSHSSCVLPLLPFSHGPQPTHCTNLPTGRFKN
jgi:hypothetical protein